jgi:cathepsin L
MCVVQRATLFLGFVAKAVALVSIPSADHSFASFVAEHGRTYAPGSREYEDRRMLFESRVEDVERHNSNSARLWNKAINHLSDRTSQELSALRGLRVIRAKKQASAGIVTPHRQGAHFLHQITKDVIPNEVSWANLTAIQADTDQDACGSCWAVATATMLRANSEINGYSRTFSAQELVDCVPNPHSCGGHGGCSGSTVELAMNWVMEKSLATSDDTPYNGDDGTCKKATSYTGGAQDGPSLIAGNGDGILEKMVSIGVHGPNSKQSLGLELGLKGWERLPENEYEPLIRAVATKGPVAVAVAADLWSSYGSGILNGCDKNAVVDHAVVLIGYGVDATKDNTPYFLIKNSWGSKWGENGNIRIFRHTDERYCGTDNQPEVGTGCEGGPSSVEVCGSCGILYDSVIANFHPSTPP